mmetsp:Transcript_8823/g.34668  ORF Transcript_8823/g.34668 Transcript_8823/m.34668 type:complete len:223 (+) Transcript_8823:1972-2640(+)
MRTAVTSAHWLCSPPCHELLLATVPVVSPDAPLSAGLAAAAVGPVAAPSVPPAPPLAGFSCRARLRRSRGSRPGSRERSSALVCASGFHCLLHPAPLHPPPPARPAVRSVDCPRSCRGVPPCPSFSQRVSNEVFGHLQAGGASCRLLAQPLGSQAVRAAGPCIHAPANGGVSLFRAGSTCERAARRPGACQHPLKQLLLRHAACRAASLVLVLAPRLLNAAH